MAQNKKRLSAALIRLFLLAITLALPALALGGSSISPASAAAPIPSEVAGIAKPSDTAQTVVMRVYFRDTAERDKLAFELAATEASTRDGYLTVFTERAEYDRVVANLAASGVRYEIDEEQTYFANHPEAIFTSSWDGSPDTFFNGYRTVAENYAFMDALVAAYPNLAEKVDIGDSWCKTHPGVCTQPVAYNGHDLYVLHITNRSIAGPKPVFWYETAIHSREIASPEMATRFMSQLLDGYNTNPDSRWLVDWHDIWVMPHVNPDGHFIAENGNSTPRTQRKNADKDDGCTAYPPTDSSQFGTDLNRNFPFKWGCCGGSEGFPCSLVYRGPSAGSEEETQAVVNKIRSLIPDQRGPNDSDAAPITTTGIYQSMHTYAGLTLYPWGWTAAPSPNNTEMRNIALHTTATNAFPAGNNYEACQGPAPNCLYEVDGDSFDWGYGELGIPSYTTELAGSTFFPNFTTIANLYNQNQGMLTYMAKVARTPYLTTRGPDADTLVANPMTTTAGSPIQLTGRANYNWTGRDQNGVVANLYLQNVASAEYYIDTPPWAGGTGIPLSPTDGSFNATTEGIQATIDTTGLTPGRHIVMVRGRGVNDYGGFQSWGPITGVFIDITGGGATATPTTPAATSTATTTTVATSSSTSTTPPATSTSTGTNTTVPPTSTSTSVPPTSTSQVSPTCAPGGGPYEIALVLSDDKPSPKLVQYIQADPDVSLITTLDARFTTPDLATLLQYDLIVVYSNTEYDDPIALGNVVADYQDAGGIVVATNANWWGPPYGMEGRWMTGGYSMFNSPAPAENSTSTLGTHDPTHPLMQGVTELTAFFRTQATLATGATQVASWADNWPLVAYKTTNGHTAVGINAYFGFPEEGWDGDVGTLIVNAARWLSPGGSCGSSTPQVTTTTTAEPSATGTGTTEPTSTGTITSEPTGSVTAQPTSTACVLQFTDVPEGSTFYEDIRCLACRGIINGYTTGCETGNPCFRPGNLVTRGQLAKIVANAANFTEPATGQQYEDVPEGSTFYEFIWRLTDRGLVNGYPCGGVGEPCGDPALPYFRPNANVTRGQLAKIVANGAGLTEPVTGQQYEDVEIGSTFYEYIGRLSALGVINGYPCGGPGEPCGDPALPYFRPGNNATRGQASKIVANTFFPGCETPLR